MATTTGVGTISLSELQWKLDRGEPVVLIETLPEDEYRKGHLPGALNVPLERVVELVPSLVPDRSAEIVVYCAGPHCKASTQAARELAGLGYTDVRAYEGGKKDWIDQGLQIEGG